MFKKSRKSILSPLILTISLGCYLSVKVPPSIFWPAAILGYAIPVVVFINLFLFVFYLLLKNKRYWFHLAGLLFAVPFIWVSFNVTGQQNPVEGTQFRLMSFNAKLFRESETYEKFSRETIDWVTKDSSDIKCIQEFSYNPDNPKLDVLQMLKDRGYYHYNFQIDQKHNPGLAIFSKYPIVSRGIVNPENTSVNNMIYADVTIGPDTVRIYNVHLKSMRFELERYKESDRLRSTMKIVINKLRYGAIDRAYEIRKLLSHVDQCMHPVVICGDFNETPYSYNYFTMKSKFNNSFEEVGKGFGFTFHGQPMKLRIDHHFYNDKIEVAGYWLDHSMEVSDHYPSRALYSIKGLHRDQ